MSKEALDQFMSEIARNPELESQVTALAAENEAATVPIEELVSFAAGKGYEFTAEEISSLGEELDDADLDRVAGGTSVNSWSTSGDADDRPTEEVAFYYNKIAFGHARTRGGRRF